MNVRELIEELQRHPPDLEVVIPDTDGEAYPVDNAETGVIDGGPVVALGYWKRQLVVMNRPERRPLPIENGREHADFPGVRLTSRAASLLCNRGISSSDALRDADLSGALEWPSCGPKRLAEIQAAQDALRKA